MRALETLVTLLEDSYLDDRQATPCLETIAFVLEQSSELEGHIECTFPARRIWNVVRKAHFKSTNIRRLEAAVKIYGALAVQGDIRRNTLGKLKDLLLHPYPSVSRRSGTDENTSGDLTVLDKECCC
jgi:tubulin-specific chaperone D